MKIESVISIVGGLLGILVFALPKASVILSVVVVAAAFVFYKLPEPDIRGNSQKLQGTGVFEVISLAKYSLVAWLILVGVQQWAKYDFVSAAPTTVIEAIDKIERDDTRGRLNAGVFHKQNSNPTTLTPKGLYVAEQRTNEFALVKFKILLNRATQIASARAEQVLYGLGIALIILGLLLVVLANYGNKLSSFKPNGSNS